MKKHNKCVFDMLEEVLLLVMMTCVSSVLSLYEIFMFPAAGVLHVCCSVLDVNAVSDLLLCDFPFRDNWV